ncbi:protein kinase [Streptomyces sp. NBC_01210]|uniref:serine/threonine-protein kinase n=1 Tax=Streptomyces sp. NBC_01210 TaxID=2903774 RepID=UPI002E0D6523|nr:protein kinase [Streptomyces sp. NBC_01210]
MLSPLTQDDPAGFGAYRLIARLGSGGMGTVYLARSAGGRTVALKTMHAGIATDPGFRTRFRLETDAARIIGGHHGAIVVDADPQAETPWLATEYVLGPPLDDAVALAGPLPETSIRALGAALAGALAQLHASDVVHRDLKPSNVMITAYGPKIIDFGIARAAGDDRLTRTGAAAGTPAFMSPEQATGQEHTPAGDVFALAGVLVHAATGHGPFGAGQAADLLYRVRYADADLTGVPDALVPILTRCLSKDPSQRPTTWELSSHLHDGQGQFADHLPDTVLAEIARRATEVWQHQPYRLPAPLDETQPSTTPRTGLSRRSLLTIGGGSALGIAAAGAGAWMWIGPGKPAETDPLRLTGISSPTPKKPNERQLWQVRVSGHPGASHPGAASTPIVVGDLVALVVSSGLAAVDARTGKTAWTTGGKEFNWQIASDGEAIHRLAKAERTDDEQAGVRPLVVETVDLTTGEPKQGPRLRNSDGAVPENQLVSAGGGVVHLAAAQSTKGPWFLAALDMASGNELWRQPLPPLPAGSKRLHFLAGRSVGDKLVLLQETAKGEVRVVVRNSLTGKVVWDKPWAGVEPDQVRGLLATDETHVFLGLGDLRALRLSDGHVRWRDKAMTHNPYGPAAVADGVVYAVQKGINIIGRNAEDGSSEWLNSDGGLEVDLSGPVVVGTEHLYSKGPYSLRISGLEDRRATDEYSTTGTRFIGHERARVVVALGGGFLSAFPLQ